jgi:hypothetical protein
MDWGQSDFRGDRAVRRECRRVLASETAYSSSKPKKAHEGEAITKLVFRLIGNLIMLEISNTYDGTNSSLKVDLPRGYKSQFFRFSSASVIGNGQKFRAVGIFAT